MIDIKFLRENPDVVKENIKKKFQDSKLPLVDQVIELDEELRFSVIRANEQLAFSYFKSAARHDKTYVADLVAKGQFLYAKCYLDGLGTDFDRVQGTRLMLVAGKSGSEEAIGYLMENGINISAYLKDGGVK